MKVCAMSDTTRLHFNGTSTRREQRLQPSEHSLGGRGGQRAFDVGTVVFPAIVHFDCFKVELATQLATDRIDRPVFRVLLNAYYFARALNDVVALEDKDTNRLADKVLVCCPSDVEIACRAQPIKIDRINIQLFCLDDVALRDAELFSDPIHVVQFEQFRVKENNRSPHLRFVFHGAVLLSWFLWANFIT